VCCKNAKKRIIPVFPVVVCVSSGVTDQVQYFFLDYPSFSVLIRQTGSIDNITKERKLTTDKCALIF
jgi:hypothetical protein